MYQYSRLCGYSSSVSFFSTADPVCWRGADEGGKKRNDLGKFTL